MQDLISIIIPIYKVPIDFLKRSIESCINQDYENIEVILIDDGSPDECGEICDSYDYEESRVRVIHQENKGLSGARNTGVRCAKGKWIMFVDGDDYLEYNCCKEIMNKIHESTDVLCFGSYRDTLKRKTIIKTKLDANHVYIDENEHLQLMTLDFNAHVSTSWAKIIKRSFLMDENIFHNEDLRQGAEGIEFCIRLFDKAHIVEYYDKPLYNYVYNEYSISALPTEENNYYVLECFKRIRDSLDLNNEKMMRKFYERMSYVVVTTIVSGYFNPRNEEKYLVKKKKLMVYLKEDIVSAVINDISGKLDFKRKIILYLAKYKMFALLQVLAKFYKKKN